MPRSSRLRLRPALASAARTRLLRALALLAALRDRAHDKITSQATHLGRKYPALRALWATPAVAGEDAQSRAAREAALHYSRLHAILGLPLLLLLPNLWRSFAAACRGWSLKRALIALVPPVPPALTRLLFGTGESLHVMPDGFANVTVAAKLGLLPPDFGLADFFAFLLAASSELLRFTTKCLILVLAVITWRAGWRWLWPRTRDVDWAKRWALEATEPMRQPRQLPQLE
jgi:hypothetical protein